jgi:N-acetylglutamate synthase-like GNAT family acetyltransferase
VLGGDSPPDRATDDFDNMEATYFRQPQNHFWVAEVNDRLVGMIGLIGHRSHVAVIRRLRVAPEWQETGIGRRLVKKALWHAWLHAAVKVVVDAPCESDRAIQFLAQIGFQYTRTRNKEGRNLIEFYPTLYARPQYAGTDA